MKVGVFDSGLGGLTVVQAIAKNFKGAEIFYIADTKFAPYGEKTHEQILQHSLDIANYLIEKHKIEALIVACNTATSAAINCLRQNFQELIVIGTEPGIKPAIDSTLNGKVGVLATPATLKGNKYQQLANDLVLNSKIEFIEQECPGLVEQIENGFTDDEKTIFMLNKWLKPMHESSVDTIVLGCTHYPLVSDTIKQIMGANVKLIETGNAIARRLEELSLQKGHKNCGALEINVYFTGEININMIDKILENWSNGGKIDIKSRAE